MVEMNPKTPDPAPKRTGGRRFDWIAIHEGWRAGESADALAEAYGLKASTIILRCGWIDENFPAPAPVRLIAELNRRLERAMARLDEGDAAQAEKQARTIAALIRAGRDLKQWSETMTEQKTGATPAAQAEAPQGEKRDYYAEVDRRLDRLAEHLRAKGMGAQSDAGGDQARR
ncbi:MAG: hypothetical protein CMH91_09925 [Oceanicaulis sp.]|jgi:hypothetical protein|nr:hypothetical protein [Oceanicaulis sp.]MBC39362.1 hypothetical protein [Oceanicaulis sp.]MBG35153.1 hypothetical protein [Oceanicaulis sp.]HBU61220.1 hypothetical protein [Oceanicaulis sp.]HCR94260.1 hypothetical protein [Oceanicaulis sp.]|tara:strand:- start:2454 stop:2972 length:519 start_codon:yes stop_codon:yes gene_type:complete